MSIHIRQVDDVSDGALAAHLGFLLDVGFVHLGDALWLEDADLEDSRFRLLEQAPASVDLDVMIGDPDHQPPPRDNHHGRLYLTRRPLETLSHFCIPLTAKQMDAAWLRPLLARAQQLGKPVRLYVCDASLIAVELVKLARWFHMDSVQEAVNQWLDEDTRERLGDLVNAFPQTEIVVGVDRLSQLMAGENPRETLILGSFSRGIHLPGHHHGVHYGALMRKLVMGGYYLSAFD